MINNNVWKMIYQGFHGTKGEFKDISILTDYHDIAQYHLDSLQHDYTKFEKMAEDANDPSIMELFWYYAEEAYMNTDKMYYWMYCAGQVEG